MRPRTPGIILLLILAFLVVTVSCRRQAETESVDTLEWEVTEEEPEQEQPAPELPKQEEEPILVQEIPAESPEDGHTTPREIPDTEDRQEMAEDTPPEQPRQGDGAVETVPAEEPAGQQPAPEKGEAPTEQPERAPGSEEEFEQLPDPGELPEQQPAPKKREAPVKPPAEEAPPAAETPLPAETTDISVNILSPRDGTYYTPMVHVEGTIDGESVDNLRWDVLGTPLGGPLETDNRGRFGFSFSTAEVTGDLRLRVQAGSGGAGVEEHSVTLKDPTGGPFLEIRQPLGGTIFRSEVQVSGRVGNHASFPDKTDGIESLTWNIPGSDRSGEVSFGSAGGYTFLLDTSGLNGDLVLQLKAVDYRGQTATETVTLADDGIGPWIELREPADGSFYSSRMIVRGIVANDGNSRGRVDEVHRVSWFTADGGEPRELGFDETGSFSFTLDTIGLPGQTILTVRTEDMNGHVTDRKILLQDDGVGPFLDITSPVDGQVYGTDLVLQGQVRNREDSTSTEGEVASLEWSILEIPGKEGRVDFSGNGSFRATLPVGEYSDSLTLELSATDRHGHRTTDIIRLSPSRRETDASPEEPPLSLSLAADRVEYRSTLSVRGSLSGAEAGGVERVSWHVRGTELEGTAPVAESGNFTITTSTGGLKKTGVMIIRAGSVTRTVMLTPSSVRPRLTITAPSDGDIYRSSFILEGSVSDRPGSLSLTELASVSWRLTGTDKGGTIQPKEDGSFSLSVSTEGLNEDLYLNVVAEDTVGHVTEKNLLLRDDGVGPLVEITSPVNGSTYSTSVLCEGRMADGPEERAGVREIESAGWSIRGTNLSGRLNPDRDGQFSFSFSGIGLPETAVVEVSAVDKNAHTTVETLTLRRNTRGPALTIESPGDFGYYTDSVSFSGRVTDVDSTEPSIEILKNLSWRIAGRQGTGGYVYVEQSGEFFFSVDTDDAEGSLQVVVEAEDLFGNVTSQTVRLLDGKKPPVIEIASPKDGGFYGAGINVGGYVIDPYAADPDYGGIEKIEYHLTSARYVRDAEVVEGNLPVDNAGRFSIPLQTLNLRDRQRLTLKVYASNGNVAETSITLNEGGSGIPSFGAFPGDAEIRLAWDRLPFAEAYNLRYVRGTPEDLESAGEEAENVNPPLLLSRLVNGARYSVKLETRIDGMPVSSEVLEVIPLSGGTLKPRVEAGFQQISLEWDTIPGANRFIVYRSDGKAGSFVPLEVVDGTEYLDTSVQFGTDYYYRVAPEEVLAPEGDITAASSLAAPASRVTAVTATADFTPRGMTVYGEYAFVPAGDKGLKILDVADPARSVLKGSCATADARDVVVRGDFAYLADGQRGLKIINITDLQNPLVVGGRNTRSANGIDISGDYVYIADGPGGFRVMDVRNIASPGRVADLDIDGALDCVVDGRFAYVAAGSGGVKVVDISDPESPRETGSFFCSDARKLNIRDDILYVADLVEGLIILDVSNPELPGAVGCVSVPGAQGLEIKGDYIFLAAGDGGLVVVDVLDPADPAVFDKAPSPGAIDLGVKDNFVLLADDSGLRIIRTYLLGTSFRISGVPLPGTSSGVTLSGDKALVTSHAGGVHMINVADPAQVNSESLLHSIGTDYAEASLLWDNLLVVADGEGGVKIYTEPWNGDPLAPDLPGYVLDAVVSGSVLYTALREGGIGVIDLSELKERGVETEPLILDLPDVRALCTDGNYLYAADRGEGVIVFSLAGDRPEKMGAFPLPGVKSIACDGDVVAAAGTGGVTFIDVSDPSTPGRLGLYPTRFAEGVCASEGLFFLSEGYRGLSVLSLARNNRPMKVSTCPTVYAISCDVAGDYAFVADGDGLSIVRIIVPEWLISGEGALSTR